MLSYYVDVTENIMTRVAAALGWCHAGAHAFAVVVVTKHYHEAVSVATSTQNKCMFATPLPTSDKQVKSGNDTAMTS